MLAFRSFRSGDLEKSYQAYNRILEISENKAFDKNVAALQTAFHLPFRRERENYAKRIEQQTIQGTERQIVVLGDSLCIPRAKQDLFIDGKPSCYAVAVSEKLKSENIKIGVKAYGQRWTTFHTILQYFAEKDLSGADLIVQAGLVDGLHRIKSERQRNFTACLPFSLQKKLQYLDTNLDFQEGFISKFGSKTHLSNDEIGKALLDIFNAATQANVRSLSFLSVLKLREREDPTALDFRCNADAVNQEIERFTQGKPVNYLDLNSIINSTNCKQFLLPDRMHLNLDGHVKVGDFIFAHLTESKEDFHFLAS